MASIFKNNQTTLGDNFPTFVIGMCSGKGGSGKTTLSVNLSLSLAKIGRRVLLLDSDCNSGGVDVAFGLNSKLNLNHFFKGQCGTEDLINNNFGDIDVIPSVPVGDPRFFPTTQQIGNLVNSLSELNTQYDFMVLDTASGISGITLNLISATNSVFVVLTDEPSSIVDAYSFIKSLSKFYDVEDFNVIVNQVDNEQSAIQAFDQLDRLVNRYLNSSLRYFGFIPYDLALKKATKEQKPIVLNSPLSESSIAINDLASKIDCLNYHRPKHKGQYFLTGRLQFFRNQYVN